MNRLRIRIDHRLPIAVAVVCAALLAFAAVGALAGVGQPSAKVARAKQRSRGPRGPRGPRGWRGYPGAAGAAGAPATLAQSISINWEGSFQNASGRDSQSFVAPGIGYGEVTCSENTQWVWFTPYSQSEDVAMWTEKFQTNDTTVRTARHTLFTGPSFYEGMNHYAGEQQSQGTFTGIISARGKLGGSNGAGPAPITFRLSWNWDFDPSNPRCFVAGTFISNGG
jgi:hypothetical protein